MSTIPASAIVNVVPGVVTAGGTALQLNGLFLTQNIRVPIGTVQSFASAPSVSSFFGATSTEAKAAAVYFAGFNTCTKFPGSMLFAQYPVSAVPAYLRSGNITAVGLAGIQALSGSLTITIDGYPHTQASLSLSAATSFSSAAALIQAALSNPTEASFTASLAAGTGSLTASINDDVLTVTALLSGSVVIGAVISGTGVTAGTQIASQLSGTTGGVGTYLLTVGGQNFASGTITETYGTLTVTNVASGTISVGQTLTGASVPANSLIAGLGTGTGLTGTYIVNNSGTVASESMTAIATAPIVTFDSVSNAFVVTSGITGAPSTAAFATGTLAAPLLMTSATGAVLSQGAASATPGSFMPGIIQQTQNWATFTTIFDPDFGVGNVQKLGFAAWTNAQVNRYAYIAWDTDQTPVTQAPATQSLGYLVGPNGNNYSGICLVSEPSDLNHAYFVMGFAASLDFTALNGRATLAFKSQNGLVAGISTQQAAQNLIANNYNYFGAYATANQGFLFMYPGSISGPFTWLDSYLNQIWLNNALQVAIMNLFTNVKSIPYNSAGYGLIEAACVDPINAAINFGAIRAGVTLSAQQIATVNSQAGKAIDQTLSQRGWYLQIVDAPAQVRAARQSPSITLFFLDGQSVQQITLSSLDVQ